MSFNISSISVATSNIVTVEPPSCCWDVFLPSLICAFDFEGVDRGASFCVSSDIVPCDGTGVTYGIELEVCCSSLCGGRK